MNHLSFVTRLRSKLDLNISGLKGASYPHSLVKERNSVCDDNQIRDRDMFLHSCHGIEKHLYCGMLN
jgi:hypothetical protein